MEGGLDGPLRATPRKELRGAARGRTAVPPTRRWYIEGSRRGSATHEQHEPRREDQREDDPPEPDGVDPVEEAHAEGDPGDRRGRKHGGEAPHLSRQEPRPPVTRQDRHLVHDEEGLEVRLDRARAPSLGRRVEDDGRPRRPDRAADHAGEHAGAEPPAAALEPRGIETAPLERHGDHQHETDQPVERGRGQARERPHTGRRADNGADHEVHHARRGEAVADGDEDREREGGRVERHEHDRLRRRHEVGEKGERDETDAEASEPHDEARAEDDEGAGCPGERVYVVRSTRTFMTGPPPSACSMPCWSASSGIFRLTRGATGTAPPVARWIDYSQSSTAKRRAPSICGARGTTWQSIPST